MILGKYCSEYVINFCKNSETESIINDFCLNLNLSEHHCTECNKVTYTIQTDTNTICTICFNNKKI